MQVSVEEVGALERRMTIAVDESQIDSAIQKELQKLSKRVKIKGFRAGKVPLNVVKQHYGNEVRMQVLQDVMQSSFYDALKQEKLQPAGQPTFDPKLSGESGQGFEYTATFEIYPEIKLASIEGAKIERPVAQISDNDIDEMLQTIQKQHITWNEVDRVASKNDRVTVDFKGEIEGEAFPGGSGTDMAVEIGKGQLIAGFEDGLIGLKVDDEKTLELTFPDDYHNKDVAGKPVKFAISVKKVEEPALPAVDAELAKKLGIEDGDVEKLKKDIRDNMQRELDAALENKTKSAVMDKLLELNPVDVPTALIENESRNIANQMAQNLMQQGMPAEQAKMDPGAFAEDAKRRVSLGLILAELVKQENLSASDEDIRARVEKIAEPYEQSEQVVQWYYGNKQRLAEIESLVLEQRVVDWVLSKADVKDNSMNFNEIMYPDKTKAGK